MKEMKRKQEMDCSKAIACKYHATNLYVENKLHVSNLAVALL